MFSVEQLVKIRRVNFLYCNEGNSPVEFFAVLCNYPYQNVPENPVPSGLGI